MRLWSLHPELLDPQGLTACWREALLAQAVLRGRTRGYRHHPQLIRFRAGGDPVGLIGRYLTGLAADADRRGYHFDRSRVHRPGEPCGQLTVNSGQLAYEWELLRGRLATRSPDVLAELPEAPSPHPLFTVVDGPVADWEVSAR